MQRIEERAKAVLEKGHLELELESAQALQGADVTDVRPQQQRPEAERPRQLQRVGATAGAALPPCLSPSGLTAGMGKTSTPAPTSSDDEDDLSLLERALALKQQRQQTPSVPAIKSMGTKDSCRSIRDLKEHRSAEPPQQPAASNWVPTCITDTALPGTSGLEASMTQVGVRCMYCLYLNCTHHNCATLTDNADAGRALNAYDKK